MNLNPPFPEGIKKTLKNRGKKLKSREKDFNYRRYAYVFLTSLAHPKLDPETIPDTTSLFELYKKDEFVIGEVPKGGHMDLYDTSSGIRRLKPQITSVSINQDGGGDIYNSYIREVEIQFKVYSLTQLDNVEESFFRLGSEIELNYGWLNSQEEGEKAALKMSVYNFGFSMSSDGSYDCNLKGLAGDVFPGAQTLGGTLVLNEIEELALGDGKSNPVDISAALMAKWKTAFGLDSDEEASDEGISDGEILMEKSEPYGSHPEIEFYMAAIANTGDSDGFLGIGGDDPVRTPFIKLKSFIELANVLSGGSKEETFKIGKSGQEYQIIKPNDKKYGSSDPRKYIFPGQMSDYGEDNDYKKLLGNEPTNIENILISLNEITQIVKNKGKTVNDIFQPPSVQEVIFDLSQRIANVSGGLVNLIVVPEGDAATDKSGKYLIQNKTEMVKEEIPEPFTFVTLGANSMVKDIGIDTEFDTDLMLMMTVGNVKNGTINLAPLQSVYEDIPFVPKDEEKKKSEKVLKDEKAIPSKDSVGKDGINDQRANSIAQTMRQSLVNEPDKEKTTQPILPFQLKLGVTLDGIDFGNSGYLAPITADRLPKRFKNANVRFLITGVEHSFDGQGGWTTSLKTAMTMGG